MQAERLLLRMLQNAPWRVLPFTLKWVERRTEIRGSLLRRESGSLHLEADITDAFRMLALAGCLWTLLCVCVCTCGAAMLLAVRGLTVAARMFALCVVVINAPLARTCPRPLRALLFRT